MNYGSAQGDRVELAIRTTNCLPKAIGLGRRMGTRVARGAPGGAALGRWLGGSKLEATAADRAPWPCEQLRPITPSAEGAPDRDCDGVRACCHRSVELADASGTQSGSCWGSEGTRFGGAERTAADARARADRGVRVDWWHGRFKKRPDKCDATRDEGNRSQDEERHNHLDPLCEAEIEVVRRANHVIDESAEGEPDGYADKARDNAEGPARRADVPAEEIYGCQAGPNSSQTFCEMSIGFEPSAFMT
jgi:hypothetical protein